VLLGVGGTVVLYVAFCVGVGCPGGGGFLRGFGLCVMAIAVWLVLLTGCSLLGAFSCVLVVLVGCVGFFLVVWVRWCVWVCGGS